MARPPRVYTLSKKLIVRNDVKLNPSKNSVRNDLKLRRVRNDLKLGGGGGGGLSGSEIDEAIRSWITKIHGPRSPAARGLPAVSSLWLSGNRTQMRETLNRKFLDHKMVLAPLWVPLGAGHWVMIIFYRGDGNNKNSSLRARAYDSIPLHSTEVIVRKTLSALGVNEVDYGAFTLQPAGSLSCGLHVIQVAREALRAKGPPALNKHAPIVNLETIRAELCCTEISKPTMSPSTPALHRGADKVQSEPPVMSSSEDPVPSVATRVGRTWLCPSCGSRLMSGDRCLLCDEVEPGFEPREASTIPSMSPRTPTMHRAAAKVQNEPPVMSSSEDPCRALLHASDELGYVKLRFSPHEWRPLPFVRRGRARV